MNHKQSHVSRHGQAFFSFLRWPTSYVRICRGTEGKIKRNNTNIREEKMAFNINRGDDAQLMSAEGAQITIAALLSPQLRLPIDDRSLHELVVKTAETLVENELIDGDNAHASLKQCLAVLSLLAAQSLLVLENVQLLRAERRVVYSLEWRNLQAVYSRLFGVFPWRPSRKRRRNTARDLRGREDGKVGGNETGDGQGSSKHDDSRKRNKAKDHSSVKRCSALTTADDQTLSLSFSEAEITALLQAKSVKESRKDAAANEIRLPVSTAHYQREEFSLTVSKAKVDHGCVSSVLSVPK